jgi:hypothetical protein
MAVDAKVRAALRLKKLGLPPKPRVLSIEAEDYVDWTGDEALRIWVVIDENTTDEELLNGGEAGLQITRAIHDSLIKQGVTLFPYVGFTKPSEQLPDDEEE